LSNTEDKSSQLPNPEDLSSEPLVTELSDTDGTVSAPDELVEALREKDQFKRLAQRAQADLVNYRRRIETEQQSALVRNQQRIVLRFVDVIDQLTVALKSDSLDEVDAGWLEGINAIHKKFLSELSFEGFEQFDSLGEEFDPRKHEALLSSITADSEPNTVIAVLRPGYTHNGEVVRPAQVEIAVAEPDKSNE
jgi:molecular chaperone GrpE